ncbi:MAG TPA: LysE family transporter [Gaiellaceae bacterium]|nr:LysE family transporter [Gaiellaceae bacterium]
MRWGSLVPLLLASLGIMGSPGPATISLVAAGSAYGVRRSLGYLIGIIAGSTIVLIAVATGITAILSAVPAVTSPLIAASAIYILWLAYHVATAPPLSERAASSNASVAGGLVLGVANPKAWVAIGAVFAGAHLADAAMLDAVSKTAVLTAMIIVINAAWLVAGASLAQLLRDARRARTVNVLLAVALVVASAVAFAH